MVHDEYRDAIDTHPPAEGVVELSKSGRSMKSSLAHEDIREDTPGTMVHNDGDHWNHINTHPSTGKNPSFERALRVVAKGFGTHVQLDVLIPMAQQFYPKDLMGLVEAATPCASESSAEHSARPD